MNIRIFLFAISFLFFISCKRDNNVKVNFAETKVSLLSHNLAAFSVSNNTRYLMVFESGLGDDHTIWDQKNIDSYISGKSDVLLYDRAGYGKSGKGPIPRNIDKLTSELESVINTFLNGRKVILVGHSLGGMIVRDYAIKNPAKVAAMLFVDPSHESYNQPTQDSEDMIYNTFKAAYGADFGGIMEARELIEDSGYMDTLPDLPDIPVIVLTSMKTDTDHTVADRELWYNAHELLKNGITDFTHISTTKSGHYIMVEEPNLGSNKLLALLNKLP